MYRAPTVMEGNRDSNERLDQKEERNIEPEQNEETRIPKKMRRGLGTSRTSFDAPTSES